VRPVNPAMCLGCGWKIRSARMGWLDDVAGAKEAALDPVRLARQWQVLATEQVLAAEAVTACFMRNMKHVTDRCTLPSSNRPLGVDGADFVSHTKHVTFHHLISYPLSCLTWDWRSTILVFCGSPTLS
jgi:hypothetical protein